MKDTDSVCNIRYLKYCSLYYVIFRSTNFFFRVISELTTPFIVLEIVCRRYRPEVK